MAHHKATPEFDGVAFEKDYAGYPRWTYTPRTIASAKAKAMREGYTNFFIRHGDLGEDMRIVRYVFDPDTRHWVYS